MFVLLTELSVTVIQLMESPTFKKLVCACNYHPCPAGHERLNTPPLKLFVNIAGPLGPAFTTLNTPLVKLKTLPLPGLPWRLAKLLPFVAPAPLNKMKVWPKVKVPLVTMFSTPP